MHRSTLLRYAIIIIVTAILSSGASFYIDRIRDLWVARGGGLTELTIALKWLNQAQFAGIYVAHEKNYFKESDLDVRWTERDFSSSAVDALANGKAEFGIVSVGEFLKAIEKGEDVVAVSAFFQYSPAVIVSLKERNILTPHDLSGKSIGIIGNKEEGTLVINAVLADVGVLSSEVRYVAIQYPQIEALMRGDVDAVSLYRTSDLYALERRNIPYNIILPERYGVDLYNDILITSRKFIDRHPEVVRAFVHAVTKGWKYASEHESETIEIIMRHDNPEYHDAERERFILRRSLPLMQPRVNLPFGRMTPGQWDHTYDLFHREKLVGNFEIYRHFLPSYFFDR